MALRGIDERRGMPLQHEELRAVALSRPSAVSLRSAVPLHGFALGIRLPRPAQKVFLAAALPQAREDVDGAFYHNHGLAEAVYKTMA